MTLAATARLCAQGWFEQTALKIRALVAVPSFAYCINHRVVDRRVPTDRSSVRASSARIWTANVALQAKKHLSAQQTGGSFSETRDHRILTPLAIKGPRRPPRGAISSSVHPGINGILPARQLPRQPPGQLPDGPPAIYSVARLS